jgi:hypothetical protein
VPKPKQNPADAFGAMCLALPKVKRARWTLGKDRRDIPKDRHVYRIDKLERDFAVWMTTGDQIGAHVRHADPGKSGFAKSKAMRGANSNWIYVPNVEGDALKKLVESSYQVSQQRGGGVMPALFGPLARGVALADPKQLPPDMHAGGPAAKIIGQEGPSAFRIALWSAQHIFDLVPKSEKTALTLSLAQLVAADVLYVELLPELMKKGGRMGKTYERIDKAADALKDPEGESPPIVAARAAVQAYACLPGGYNERAVKAAGDAVEVVVRALAGAAVREYLAELDDRILIEEMDAAMLDKKIEHPEIERVLWRGIDAKGFPALWVARFAGKSYGLFWKLGARWTLTTGTRDDIVATIPDAHLEKAVDIILRRDAA